MAPAVVVDTSVAAKWFFPEPDSSGADAVLEELSSGKSSLAAPDLIVYEFANLLWKRVGRGEISADQAGSVMDDFMRLPISLAPADILAESALGIALQTGCTAYDATFIALAEYLDTYVFTADRKLIQLLSATKHARRARLPG
ncbi:MAG: PIN domain-containing protein [Gaiellales bacterium]|nr:MAG: PIN domain-containing protein [Gaiellales bacterium]